MKKLLQRIINRAMDFKLPAKDIIASQEYLDYNEYEVCLDQIVTQLYEYDIKIDHEFYQMTRQAAEKMKLPPESFDYIKALIVLN